jgi:hypothetical protein
MMKYYRCKISLRVMCSRVFASLEVRGGSPTFPPLKKSFTPTSQGKHLTSSPPPPPSKVLPNISLIQKYLEDLRPNKIDMISFMSGDIMKQNIFKHFSANS